MKKNLVWDNKNKLYVPKLICVLKQTFDSYLYYLLGLLAFVGLLTTMVIDIFSFYIVVIMICLTISVKLEIKEYYKRRGVNIKLFV